MRTNFPVTATDSFLKDGQSLFFTTDLKGRITCVHPRFIDISGFTGEKLLGSPDGLVHRPDRILMGDSVEKIENGSRLVNKARGTMAGMVSSVRRTTGTMIRPNCSRAQGDALPWAEKAHRAA